MNGHGHVGVGDPVNTAEGQLHPPGGAGYAGGGQGHFQGVINLPDAHIDVHIRAQLLFPGGVVHLPPVGGGGLLPEGQVVPAPHGLVQAEGAAFIPGHGLRDKGPVLAEAARQLHRHLDGAVVHIQEIGLGAHDRVGPASPADPGNGGIGIVGGILPGSAAEPRLIGNILRVEHVFNQEVRRGQPLPGGDVHNVICHGNEFRDVVADAQVQIFKIIGAGVDQPVLVKPGGVGGEHAVVRLPVGEHHPEVANGVLLVAGVPQALGQQEHGVVIHLVIVARALFRVLSVFIAVHALVEVSVGRLNQVLLPEEPAAAAKQGGNGPAVVGRVKAPLQQPPATQVDGMGHAGFDFCLSRGQVLLSHQVLEVGHPGQNAESGIRGGEEIAGHIVKQTVFVLHPVHIVKAQFRPGKDGLILIKPGIGIAVGCHQGRNSVHGGFGLEHAVGLNHRAAIGAAFVQHLGMHRLFRLFLDPPDHLIIMCFHAYLLLTVLIIDKGQLNAHIGLARQVYKLEFSGSAELTIDN